MNGNFTINGKDAYATWGMRLADGAMNVLLQPAEAKDLITNESRILSGKQVVNRTNVLKDRSFALPINVYASGYKQFYERIEAFVNELLSGTATMTVSYLPGVKYKVNYISFNPLSQLRGELGKIIVKLNEPNPADRS